MWKCVLILAAAAAGCAQEPSTMRQRQDEAIKDPFNYSPYEDRRDVSGGGITDFKKGAFKRDVDSVFNP